MNRQAYEPQSITFTGMPPIPENVEVVVLGGEEPDVARAEELIFDALDALDDCGYYHRGSGVVDLQAHDVAAALLAAGWAPPK